MGLERTVAMLNGYKSVYEIDLFKPVIDMLTAKGANSAGNERAVRIIADHIRTATFMLGDEKGITPSNADQGYILRRLIRRAIRYARVIDLEPKVLCEVAGMYIAMYGEVYPELKANANKIVSELEIETERFIKTLAAGLKEYEKLLGYIQNGRMSGKAAFRLYDTFGFPIEMTLELASEHGITVDVDGFDAAFKEHQEKSHAGAEQRFKGGLADTGEETAKLHTATHLLNAGLKKVLNDKSIQQKGSNITAERLRFDFNFPRPLTDSEIAAVEDFVNAAIKARVEIICEEMPVAEAKAAGAEGVFSDKYDENVKVYTIAGFSKEICGGPHAKNTADLGKFKIAKEQSSSAGIRRIKGVLS
jgi:alanyl-tRNA synthetase